MNINRFRFRPKLLLEVLKFNEKVLKKLITEEKRANTPI